MCVCVCVHSHSFLYIYIYTHILFVFFSTMIYHRMLNIVLCSIQYDLVVYSSSVYSSLHLLIRNSQAIPLPPSFPLTNHKSFSLCESLYESVFHSSICSFVSYEFFNFGGTNMGKRI